MVINVDRPTFLVNKKDYKKVSYGGPGDDNWKFIIVQTYLAGFPALKEGEVLYKYTNNRGYITTYK
jgi:hypothetical protein